MARPSNTEERRRQIVEGLIAAMAEHGYEGASMPLIAGAAGLAPGVLHYHFASKQEMLLAAMEELAKRVRARFERMAERACTARERLHAFLDAHLALGTDASPEAVACWVAIGAEAVRQSEVRAAYKLITRAALRQLKELVRDALSAERRASDGAEQMAAALMAAIYGCYQLSYAAEAAPKGYAAPMVRHMAEGLLSAAPPERGGRS